MATYYKGDGTQITIPSANSVNTAQIVDNAVTYNKLSEEVQDQLGSGSSGLTDGAKQALLNCFAHVAWINEDGQDYYDALEDALYPPATLTSISAVYTQSGTVYINSNLDELKADLVVTAHYDDSSTATVTAYTLSGTLTVGTSTITVSYGGKTTTFNTTVTNDYELPTGYTRYDYVKNNVYNNANCAIDTGLGYQYGATNYQHNIEMRWESGTGTTTGAVFGLRQQTGSSANALGLWFKYVASDGNISINYMGGASMYATRIEQSTRYNFKYCVENGEGKVYKNNTLDFTVASPSPLTSAVTNNIHLFGMGRNSAIDNTQHIHRIYSYSIYDETTSEYVAYMIPCTNSSNVAGFYDVIRETFYTASSTTTVECGNDA